MSQEDSHDGVERGYRNGGSPEAPMGLYKQEDLKGIQSNIFLDFRNAGGTISGMRRLQSMLSHASPVCLSPSFSKGTEPRLGGKKKKKP
jgi:hypothetical protein